MSPRPRKVSDDDVFAAAHAVMIKVGPGELTLAHIAEHAGVTAAALVQRFGSKRGLLLALAERFAGGTSEMFAALRERHRSPLAAIRAYADGMAGMASSPAALMRNLSYLQIDLTDPDFRQHLSVSARAAREELQTLVKAAIAQRELMASASPRQLARTLEAIISGSMLTWAFYQDGTASKWVRDDVNAVLKPYMMK